KPLHRELDLRPLVVRGNAVAHTDDLDFAESEPLIEAEELARVAGQAREVFDQDDVEGGRCRHEGGLEELLVAGSMLDPEAREGGIVELRDHHPSAMLRGASAKV